MPCKLQIMAAPGVAVAPRSGHSSSSAAPMIRASVPKRFDNSFFHLSVSIAGQTTSRRVALVRKRSSVQINPASMVLPRPTSSAMSNPRDGESSRSEEHTSELQSLMRISYAVFCLKKKKNNNNDHAIHITHINNTNNEAKQ